MPLLHEITLGNQDPAKLGVAPRQTQDRVHLPEAKRFIILNPETRRIGTITRDLDRQATLLGRVENVGRKEFDRHGDHGKVIGGSLPGGGADSRRRDKGQIAGTAAAGNHAAVTAGPAGAGTPGRTATMVGSQAGTGPMTMGAAGRLDTGRGQVAQGQGKNRADNDGPDKAMNGGGPFHRYILARCERKGKDSPGKPGRIWI